MSANNLVVLLTLPTLIPIKETKPATMNVFRKILFFFLKSFVEAELS